MIRYFFVFVFILSFSSILSQGKFTYFPTDPKPGDLITFTYVPSEQILGKRSKVEAVMSISTATNSSIDDVILQKTDIGYTGQILTKADDCFIYIGFYVDSLFDNNGNTGFHILLKENHEPVKWAYWGLARYWMDGFQWLGNINPIYKKTESPFYALNAIKSEIDNNPDAIDVLFDTYTSLLKKIGKEDTVKILINNKIDQILKQELKDEDQYITLQNLYKAINMHQKADEYYALQKQKFPTGLWYYNDLRRRFRTEKEPAKMFELLFEYRKSGKELSNWENYVIAACLRNKNWDTIKIVFDQYTSKNTFILNDQYIWVANEIVSDSVKKMYNYGIELISKAMNYFKTGISKKPEILPPLITSKMWYERAKNYYADALNVYAKILFSQKFFSRANQNIITALQYKEEVKQPLTNVYATYAMIKEKIIDHKLLKKELESKIKEGLNSPVVDSILKRIYRKRNNSSDDEFNRYLHTLKSNNYLQALEILKKEKINVPAPLFSLYNVQGNEVKLIDFIGKVVVLDFWFTQCGPCIKLFPLMKKIMNKYANDSSVVFLFINSNEKEIPRRKAVKEFLASNHYTFETLMDEDDNIAQTYNIRGFPTKIVINKSGNISFRSEGTAFDEVAFMNEMSAMIELAKND